MHDLLCLAAYFVISLISLPLVKYLGPAAITEYRLEELYDSKNGPVNVIYRILSPMLCCSILSLLFSAVFDATLHIKLNYLWFPTLIYWVLIGIEKHCLNKLKSQFLPLLIEMTLSVVLAYAADYYVLERYLNSGIEVLDQSNFAFQLELALFYVLVQIIVSLTLRRKYKVRVRCAKKKQTFSSNYSIPYSGVDVSEKKLFSYRRKYGDYLSERYKKDFLLRCVFFSIMAIEDHNRPAGARLLERLAFPVGLSKTTGIMQQQSDAALSDEESVALASNYVSEMWNKYLVTFAQSEINASESKGIVFARDYYRYDYFMLRNTLRNSFSFLYGDYCGSYVLNADKVFIAVLEFEERLKYGLMPKKNNVKRVDL